jgi:predicted RND superfamily exporter protein
VLLFKGRAMMSSSLILCIGFGVLLFGSFVPTMNFGLLTAIIMITALVGDMVVLPSILLLKR